MFATNMRESKEESVYIKGFFIFTFNNLIFGANWDNDFGKASATQTRLADFQIYIPINSAYWLYNRKNFFRTHSVRALGRLSFKIVWKNKNYGRN